MAPKGIPGDRVVICCYCDARSLVPVSGAGRLVCHGCGAPIKNLLSIEPSHTAKRKKSKKPAHVRPAERPEDHGGRHETAKRRKGKRSDKKAGFLRSLSRAVDDLDDLFDIFD